MAGFNFKAEVRMKLKHKSQVTMIIIVGLVLFIVVSLVLYLAKSTTKKQSKQIVKQTQETAIETQPIKEFVAKCLDKTAKDAVILLGKQGGYIYTSQGGTLIKHASTDEGLFFVNYNNLRVVYSIMPPRFSTSTFSSEVPDYPWVIFPYTTSSFDTESFAGFFGISNMPPLYASDGPHSIQAQIESFVDKNIASCVDFSIFNEQGLEIEMLIPKTSVVVGSKDIRVNAKIPITIINPKTKEIKELIDFTTNLEIRLNDIYAFVKELIRNDIQNIKFNISNFAGNSLNVKLVENVYSSDDVVIVTDEKSLVAGKPYQFVFARKNRAPALYYLKNTNLEFEQGHLITQEDLLQGSELKAEDPDGDEALFTIKALSGNPELPRILNVPQLIFRVEVSDGQLIDYQDITVNRIQ